MQESNNDNLGIDRPAGSKKRRRFIGVVFIWVVVGLAFARNWGNIRTYLLRLPEPTGQHLSVTEYIRRPLPGKDSAHQSMVATLYPDRATQNYIIHAKEGDSVEVGLVRMGTEFSDQCEYVFSVSEITDQGKRRLFRTSAEFPLDTWKIFRTDMTLKGRSDGTAEIQYVLKPRGIRNKLSALTAAIKGLHYYKDFAFLNPGLLHPREPGELNVIVISFDTLRADHLGCFGYSRQTSPNIDSLARQGILFTQAITSSPWTLPSHFSLFTGLYPSAQLDSGDGLWETRSYAEKLMAGILKENGYYTIATGSLPASVGFNSGFCRYREIFGPNTRKIFEDAMNWIEALQNFKFFMFIHHYECHKPYQDTYFLQEMEDDMLVEKRKALYDGDIRRADAFFGRLMERLESLDLLSNTIIVFVSDHGEHFYDHFTEDDRIPPGPPATPQDSNIGHGHSVHEELVRVPLIFYVPDFVPDRNLIENQVSLIDVLPTLLDYLNIQYHEPIQGASLVQLMKTGERANEPFAICEFTHTGPEQKAVRMNGYKYIYIERPDEKKQEVTFKNIPQYALFDLRNDPGEKKNIYSENRQLAQEYHAILQSALEESLAINNELRARKKPREGGSRVIPDDTVDALKALGYMN